MSDVTNVATSTNAASLTFMATGRGKGTGPTGRTPSEQDHVKVNDRLTVMAQNGDSKTKMVEFLLGEGWSVAAICQKIRYETTTSGHNAGDPLKYQHVNAIKIKMAERTKAATQATPAANQSSNNQEYKVVEPPKSELRKS